MRFSSENDDVQFVVQFALGRPVRCPVRSSLPLESPLVDSRSGCVSCIHSLAASRKYNANVLLSICEDVPYVYMDTC